MRTSASVGLSKPQGDEKISRGTFAYIKARVRHRVFDLIAREFKKSGITQAQLARRWGKTPDIVCRLLSRPSNMEVDTVAEVLFAIGGAVPTISATYPINEFRGNFLMNASTTSHQELVDLTPSSPGEFKIEKWAV